jgi:hypothetical protein
MLTIPEDDLEPDLFDIPPGPAPVQYELFEEEQLQQLATAAQATTQLAR